MQTRMPKGGKVRFIKTLKSATQNTDGSPDENFGERSSDGGGGGGDDGKRATRDATRCADKF